MSQGIIWPLIFLQIAAVVAIILFLRAFLHKQLEVGVKRIQRLDQDNLKKEAELNKSLQQLDKEREARLKKADDEAKSRIEIAKEEIKKMREDERIKAKDEGKRLISNAFYEKEKLMKESEHEIFNKGLDLSMLMLKRIFSEEELKDLRVKITKGVTDFIIDSPQVESLLKNSKELEVVTAEALAGDEKNHITKLINTKCKGKGKVKFSVDKNVLGGLMLKVGEQIIDGSLAYRINKAAIEMRENYK